MDPISSIGLAGSLVSIIDGTAKAIQYLNSVGRAFKDHEKLCQEANNLLPILTNLRQKVQEATQDGNGFQGAAASHGVVGALLDQMKKAMEELSGKLGPSKGWKRARMACAWVSTKKECADILASIERLKSLIELVLQQDLLLVLHIEYFQTSANGPGDLLKTSSLTRSISAHSRHGRPLSRKASPSCVKMPRVRPACLLMKLVWRLMVRLFTTNNNRLAFANQLFSYTKRHCWQGDKGQRSMVPGMLRISVVVIHPGEDDVVLRNA
jgi:hypothetical protein